MDLITATVIIFIWIAAMSSGSKISWDDESPEVIKDLTRKFLLFNASRFFAAALATIGIVYLTR